MYTIRLLELALELDYKLKDNNSEQVLLAKIKLQNCINKLIIINAEPICTTNILYCMHIESELLNIKDFMGEGT